MNISFWRIAVLFGVITFIYCMRNLEVFKNPFSIKNLKQELILVGILGIFFSLICLINYYTVSNDYDFYSKDFVEAICNGKFSIEPKPSQNLIDMDNPYDTEGRDSKGVRRNVDYQWDTALYKGEAYIYFGILPVLALLLPYHLITRKIFIFFNNSIDIFNFISNSN